MGTAGEIVIWMVLAALVGFATGWALRSVVANRARARLSERLEEKRREAQDLREELRHLRGGDDGDVIHVPGALAGPIPDWEDGDEQEEFAAPGLSATAEHDEVELGPLDEPTIAERRRRRSGDRRRDPDDEPGRGAVGRRRRRVRRGGAAGPAGQAGRRGVRPGRGANRDELSPLALLRRSASAYPERIAVRDGDRA